MFDRNILEPLILERGKDFFESIRGESPSVFNKSWWTGKVMDWSMKNEGFKVQMFRFVDVLPYLTTADSLNRHIEEYFGGDEHDVPAVLKWGAGKGVMGGKLASKALSYTLRGNIEKMARQFIIGEQTKEAIKNIKKLRKDNFAIVVDLLGEATVSEDEADAYLAGYLELLDAMAQEQKKWKPLGGGDNDLDWGTQPKINVSVKPSAFYSQVKTVNQEGSVRAIYERVSQIYRKVKELGGFLCIDMEQNAYKEITLELFKRLRTADEFKDYEHLGIVLQSYLRETDHDLDRLLTWARDNELPISIRLVKGAYWDYETVIAKQQGLPVPVYTIKAESDAAFERHTALILQNHDICHLACGSHNIRSISATLEMAKKLHVPENRYEFQVLYGMAEPVRKGLLNVAKRVRLYCPYGELLPGMAYLVRRLLENTANESFLRQSFSKNLDVDKLLENPELTTRREADERDARRKPMPKLQEGEVGPFRNEPHMDFTMPGVRESFPKAIADARAQMPKNCPLFINGEEVDLTEKIKSVNPADPNEVVGLACQASKEHVDQALDAANAAFPAWRDTAAETRAKYLLKAADIMRARIYELSAWQVLEVGKQWDQAYMDVAEAIDFMEYYARDMIRLGSPQKMGNAPGELNHYFYQPCGLAAVISPWNFPMAISCGMASAAIVTGNCVLFKPANITPVIGYLLAEIYREAGLPAGVFNYVPGKGSEIGDYIVEHPDIKLIAFTGSMEVGLRILQKTSVQHPGQAYCKKVVCEMGGKNGIIIDDDADLDEAVLKVLYSSFGFQGQKCSACSRVIVLDAIYEKFTERLKQAANSLKIGPPEDPANYMGPVADSAAQKKVQEYAQLGKEEGRELITVPVPASLANKGYYVPITIVEDIKPEHRLAQEEVFGPVLALMRAKNMDHALDIANSTQFALTGAIFSRSPKHLERARNEFRVGNLYLNQGSTGALVERQAFGGFKLSGVGSKTGGPDYLLRFMDPRVVSENTMRRGFAPIDEDDDWVE